MRGLSTRVAAATLAIGAVGLLGACNNDKGGAACGFQQKVQGEGNSESTVNMCDPKIPADFPTSAVPLPEVGKLQSVVTGRQPPNHFYTFTYSLAGQNGRVIGDEYRRRLVQANFTIKNPSSTGGSDGGFTTFDATSPRWDVTVLSGKASKLEQSSLSIQVTTHGTLSDDLDELDVLDNTPVIDPNDPNATSTTSSTLPAP